MPTNHRITRNEYSSLDAVHFRPMNKRILRPFLWDRVNPIPPEMSGEGTSAVSVVRPHRHELNCQPVNVDVVGFSIITGIRMRRALALALASSAATLSASAQDFHGSGLRPFVGAGFTWGGDTIEADTITPIGSSTHYQEDISAGAGLALQFGLSYRVSNAPWTLQASVGYHNDQASGLNGRSYFRRIPLELMAQWHAGDRTRLGFGVRRGTRAKFLSEGGTCGGNPCPTINERMKGSTGLVLEVEQMVTPSWGVKARYVHEYYRFNDSTVDDHKYDGNHIGLMTTFYFN